MFKAEPNSTASSQDSSIYPDSKNESPECFIPTVLATAESCVEKPSTPSPYGVKNSNTEQSLLSDPSTILDSNELPTTKVVELDNGLSSGIASIDIRFRSLQGYSICIYNVSNSSSQTHSLIRQQI